MGKEVGATPQDVIPTDGDGDDGDVGLEAPSGDDLARDASGVADTAGSVPPAGAGAYARNTALMSVGTVLSRATGLVRVAVLAWALGVQTSLSATYTTANTAPNILYELVLGGILTSVFIPVFVQRRRDEGRQAAWQVADRLLTIAAVLLAAIAVLGVVLAPQIARFYLRTDDATQLDLATFLIRWFMPQIVFYGVGAIAGGLLNAEGRFAAPMFAPVLNNLLVIATVIAYAWIRGDGPATVADVTAPQRLLLGAGTTLGVVAMTVALWPSLRAVGYRWRGNVDWRHPAVSQLLRLSSWVFLYVGANQVALAIVVRLTNGLDDAGGAITAYQFAFLIFSLPHAVFAVSIITALLPSMADRWTAGDRAGLIALFSRGARDTSVLMIPAAFGLAALSVPLSRLLLQRGLTTSADAELVGNVLLAFALALPFFSVFQLLTRTFYAMQDSRTPALTNIVGAIVNVGAAVGFAYGLGLGVAGIALGFAASYVVGTTVLVVLLRRRTGGLDGARIAGTLVRVVPAAVLTGAAAFVVSGVLGHDRGDPSVVEQLLQVVVAVAVGMLVFAGVASIVGVREVRDVAAALRRRFPRVTTRASDERGMVGKLAIVWLLVLALLGVAAVDAGAIMLARFRLSDAATRAATDAAASMNRGQAATEACAVAAATLDEEEPDARRPRRGWCEVDPADGRVTIRLRTQPSTLLAERLSFTRDLTVVTVEESAGRSSL